MLPGLMRYCRWTCVCLILALAAPSTGFSSGGRKSPAPKRSAGAVKKAAPKKTTPRKARKPRKRRPATARRHTTLTLDSCITATFSPEQSALRTHIERWLDVRYKTGGSTMKGVDCSGFLVQVYGDAAKVRLPRTSKEQASVGERVQGDALAFGDLLFFHTRLKSRRISHVGIYIGDDRFVHASRHRGVGVDQLSSAYYSRRFVMARRVLGEPDSTIIE